MKKMKSFRKGYFLPYCLVFIIMLVLSTQSASAETYQYDLTGRLTSVTYDDGSSITYNFDNAGNLLQKTIFIEMILADTILVLQVIAGIEPFAAIYKEADVNGDNQIGLEEVIYILQKVSGLR